SAWSSWSTSNWTGSADVNPVADRLTAGDFYILDGAHLYLSTNGGVSWTLKSSSAPSGTLEASFAAAGDLWISANGNGLWHSTNFGATWTHVASAAITNSSSVGFGKAAAGQTYPAIYVTGSGNGTTGMFRSDDGGTTWLTISDSQHQFSGAIVGDRNIYGRVYIGAGARGVIYGDIQSTAPSAATAAAASPVVGNTSNLSVLGSDDGGESNLTYTWRVTNKPPGSTLPTFSTNGTNAAKNTVATFAQPGFYSFQVALTDAQGHVMISSVGLTVFVSIGAFNSDLDIGSPSPTGSSSYNAGTGTYTVAGGGSDIWNTSDQFHFLSKSFTGDGVMIARVTSVQNTNTWAKAGVMFRDSTAANSMFADVLVSYSSGVTFQWRNSTGGTADYALISGIAAPAWVKLVRGGNSFTAFYATTAGTPAAGNWIQIGTPQAIAMGSGIQAGLAVTSHANGTLCTSTFTGVLVNQNPTVATAASATPNPANSTTSALSALGADDGGEANLAYTWSTTGAPPAAVSFSANGTNAAKNTTATFTKAGTYSFLVTVTDALGLATTSAVSVVVNQSPTLVTVAPNPVTVAGGATKQFSATVTDQFGQPIVSPSVTWSTSGGGSTDTSGLFTASQTGGAFNVTAKSGSASGSAAVNVVPSIYTGTASADNYYVRLSADGVTEQLWVGSTTGAGVPTYTIAQSQLTSLAFNGMGGADSLTVDFTNGNPVPSSGVSFDGGSGSTGNLLVVDGSGSADTATLSASSVVFNSVAPIAYANTQSLTLATAGGNDVVTQAAQPAVPNVVFNGGSGSDTLNVNAGAFSFNTDAGAGTSSLTVNVAGNGSSASFSGDQHLAGLTLTSSAVVVVTAAASDLSPAIVNVTALGFDASAGAKLDLVNNELITGDSLSLVRSLIVQGHLWTSIAGRAVGSSDMGGGQVEARPTLQGDANLDGSVNVGDLGSLATHYGTSSGAVWTDGDFDYNGAVDVADLGYLASGFAASLGGAAVPAAMAASISATDAPATSIPTQKSDAAKPTRSTSFTFATGSSLGDLTTPRESIADLTDHHHGRHLYDSFWRSESEPLDPA
ncbi:MAG TPA: hypothetical protein VLI90_02990, partial [Tepidisphaeraceae bacterium]|nr:hypothetical protein [Tepidisphaeraceae bacterium]